MAHSLRGRTLYVQFECGRCGKVHFEPYDNQYSPQDNIDASHIINFQPPKTWTSCSYLPLLCDECTTIYKEFMKNFIPTP